MPKNEKEWEDIPLYISRSTETTDQNKTGTWRFSRPLYEEKTAPCSAGCPVGEDIPRVEMLASQGRFREAWETIMWENPFPAICGRVCFHPCERNCNRGEFDEPIAIRHLERFIGDTGLNEGYRLLSGQVSPQVSPMGKTIAIIGAGPSGLSAGWFLTRLGYACHIFESQSEPGGLLRYGIPEYRLPRDILNREIDRLRATGVEISCNSPMTHLFLEEARSRFDAVFFGCGYAKSLKLNVTGEDLTEDGLGFLSRISRGWRQLMPGRAAVIGGGNTAVDVARTIVRLGGSPVLVYRRRQRDMPAFDQEVRMALSEGVELMELVAPIQYEKAGEEIELTLQGMRTSDADNHERTRVVPLEGKTEKLRVRRVFTAIGNEAEAQWMPPSHFTERSLNLHHCTLVEDEIPVVRGGDLTNPIKSVTDAIASGKVAAMALDTLFKHGWDEIEKNLAVCLTGSGPARSMRMYENPEKKVTNPHVVSFSEINTDYFESSKRVHCKMIGPTQGDNPFAQIERTLFSKAAMAEARRCFNCGICNECDNCRLFCPELAVFGEEHREINFDYCKGCGICVVECPRNAMTLEEEKS